MKPTIDPPNAYPKLDEAVRDHMKRELLSSLPTDHDIWIFGYGSLMWNPGFEFTERQEAYLPGWQRSFCVFSHRYRGTPEKPGLVLGLDRGAGCHGVAFRTTPAQSIPAMEYLWDREMVTGVYEPMDVTIEIDGKSLACHTFVADRAHPQYAGDLPDDEKLVLIKSGVGSAGPNPDYLFSTVDQLDAMGIEDDALHSLARKLKD